MMHTTFVGGAVLEKCKLGDGSWNVEFIMDGQYDNDARRQIHITKNYYPEVEWKALEPLKRRKVFLNRMNNTGGGGDAACTGECERHER